MFTSLDVLKSALGAFFKYNFYNNAVVLLRKAIREQEYYSAKWEEVILLILNRNIEEGGAQNLIEEYTNLPLYENSEEEAYRWLTLMLINSMGSENISIIDYKDSIKPIA